MKGLMLVLKEWISSCRVGCQERMSLSQDTCFLSLLRACHQWDAITLLWLSLRASLSQIYSHQYRKVNKPPFFIRDQSQVFCYSYVK